MCGAKRVSSRQIFRMKLFKHGATRAYGGSEIKIYAFLSSVVGGVSLSV
jgi:hypothetical protein